MLENDRRRVLGVLDDVQDRAEGWTLGLVLVQDRCFGFQTRTVLEALEDALLPV